jgi:hypothetical protein
MDGLLHFAHNRQMDNGLSVDTLKKSGIQKLGYSFWVWSIFNQALPLTERGPG